MYRYNFKSARQVANPCRLYTVGDEKGLVKFAWPVGAREPAVPIPYAEESWSGLEYMAAAHMIQEGFVEEGLEIVKSARERYDGAKRNPWSEIECGRYYARSMSSYALLLALSGFSWDARTLTMGFDPKTQRDGFTTFWCNGAAWGLFLIEPSAVILAVQHGVLKLAVLRFPLNGRAVKRVAVSGKEVDFRVEEGELSFPKPLTLKEGDTLVIELAHRVAASRD